MASCVDYSHDNGSHGKNPSLYHNPVGKVAVTFAVSNAILFVFTDTLFRVSLIDKKYYHYFINYQSTVLK